MLRLVLLKQISAVIFLDGTDNWDRKQDSVL